MRLQPLVCGALLLAGCAQPAAHDSVAESLLTAPDRAYDAISYDLKARFDWTKKILTATEQVTLLLQNSKNAQVELDSAVQVSRVHVGNLDLPFTQDVTAKTLRVDLTKAHPQLLTSFTVEYTTGTSTALLAAGPRDGDPVQSRVVFTDSEPDRGCYWLVANHHPADRAIFSVELTVDAGEDVVANGERIEDRTANGQRTVRYLLPAPIPTYLMAFAGGQMVHADRHSGRVPLSVWYRKGLVIDTAKNLDIIADAMHTFEKLLGPYPWERYSVVLLPDYYGGMENTTITFNYEPSGQGLPDFTIDAHELSHHWFGDWVTMHDFDDVWVKEGMATVLESEADRARRDTGSSGRLFGYDFQFAPTDAIVDDNLKGLDKYTSGPYQRAAWMITQIRATVGEANFWRSLRQILSRHALGSITGEQFVRSFAPALDEKSIEKILATLPQKPTPAVAIDVEPTDTGSSVTLTLSDPSSAIVSAPTLAVIDAAGNATPATLTPGTPLTLQVPTGGYLASDEHDVHPDWSYSFSVDPEQFWSLLAPLYFPSGGPALTAFGKRSPAQQERALNDTYMPINDPTQFGPFYAALTSSNARTDAEIEGCYHLGAALYDPAGPQAWSDAVTPILENPAHDWTLYGDAACGPDFATKTFAPELTADAASPTAANAPRLTYLMSFDYGVEPSFATLSSIATTAPSLQLREAALNRLVAQTNYYGYQTVEAFAPQDVPLWQQFFTARVVESTSAYHFEAIWPAITALQDVAALPATAGKLHSIPDFGDPWATSIVCGSYEMAQGSGDPSNWSAFQAASQPWTTLSPAVQALLADPTGCFAGPSRIASRGVHAQATATLTPIGALVNRPDAHVGEHHVTSRQAPQQH